MIVKDLDPLMNWYRVAVTHNPEAAYPSGRFIGEKTQPGVYRRPERSRHESYLDTQYKAQPPWMTMEVVKICNNTIFVKERKKNG